MKQTDLDAVRTTTLRLDADNKFTVMRQTSIRPLDVAMSTDDAALEDLVTGLLSVAAASGRNIMIENKGVPQYGMGGYYSEVTIRPDHNHVRYAMDVLQARREGTPEPEAPYPRPQPASPQLLRCRDIYWDESKPEIKAALQGDPSHLPHHVLVQLLREYDRRLMQMWDKVGFEGQHKLVDYSLLDKPAVTEPQPLLPALNDAIKDQREYFLSVFESRYGHGVIAMLSFDMQFPLIVQDLFQGGDDDNAFIQTLLQFDWYPIAAGKTTEEAINNLDAKLRRITFSKTTPLLIHWLDYVAVINARVREGHVYEIVHAQYEDAVENAYASGN